MNILFFLSFFVALNLKFQGLVQYNKTWLLLYLTENKKNINKTR